MISAFGVNHGESVSKAAPSVKSLVGMTDPRKLARAQGRIAAKSKAQGGQTWGDMARQGAVNRSKSRGEWGNYLGSVGDQAGWAHARSGVLPRQLGN